MTPLNAPPSTGWQGDRIWLEGPRSRWAELRMLLHIVIDFLRGFRALHFVGPCVTVFGSARTKESDPHYTMARELGAAISKLGFTVMTGGGPGIMEAANRGAKDVGGRSVGCNIQLDTEQHPNPFLDRWVTIQHFFVRKTLLIKYSYAFVVMPGGYGTLDELFEALTLVQTRKIGHFPIVVMGTAYWKDLLSLTSHMVEKGTISKQDLELIFATDSVSEAVAHIEERSIKPFGLRPRVPKHLFWLGERGWNQSKQQNS